MSSSHLIRIDLGEACPTSPRKKELYDREM
jgi:hypothetical protein